MSQAIPEGFDPWALVTSPDGNHWAAAGSFDDDEEAVVVDGTAGDRFANVGRPVFTTSGVVYTTTNDDDEDGVVAPNGTFGPYEGGLQSLQTNGDQFAYVNRAMVKGKIVLTVFINGEDMGTFREMGLPIPHPEGGYCIQADLTGQKAFKGLEHKRAILRNGEILVSGPGLQYGVIGHNGTYYLENAGKEFRVCRDGEMLESHEWMTPPAAHPTTDATAWGARDNGRWKIYASGTAHGDYDDVKRVDVAHDGSFAASVQHNGDWYAVTANAKHGPLKSLSTISAGPGHRIAYVAHAAEGLIVGIDDQAVHVHSAGTVAFCADGAVAYAVAREEGAWMLVHAHGEEGPFEQLSSPVRIADHFVAHGLRDGVIVRIQVSAR